MSESNKPYEAPEWLAKHVAAELTFDLTQTEGSLTTYVMDDPTVSAAIARELGLVTICVLVLTNGWKEVGYSAPVDPKDFDTAVGIDCARRNAYERLANTIGLTQAFARKDALDVTAGLAESGAALVAPASNQEDQASSAAPVAGLYAEITHSDTGSSVADSCSSDSGSCGGGGE